MKIAGETNTTIIEIEQMILQASINNWTMNTINILGISEDLWYLIQSNIEDWVFQIQRMLADELDTYRGKRNQYMDDNIREIQELYKNEEQEKELNKGRVEDEEIILIKPYEVVELTSLLKSSFIDNKVKTTWSSTWSSFVPPHKQDCFNYPYTINHSNLEESKIPNSRKK